MGDGAGRKVFKLYQFNFKISNFLTCRRMTLMTIKKFLCYLVEVVIIAPLKKLNRKAGRN
jgi:hypothetical protein